ncbi:diguanylate cyclase [Amycolatopsis cihanbeyliensis]
MKGWALWQLPKPVLGYVLAVNTVAIAVSAGTALLLPVTRTDVIRFALLAGCAAVAIELTRQVERQREYNRSGTVAYVDSKAVWSFAAVIVLPPVLASAMVLFTYALAWYRVWPHTRPVPPHRWIFSCATVLCGTQAAVAVLALGMRDYPGAPSAQPLAGLADLGIVAAAALLRWVINMGLVMAAIALSNPPASVKDLFHNFGQQLLEVGAMGLGLVAAAVVVAHPAALAGIVLALVAMHRTVLLAQYRQHARTDTKTGLANPRWWHQFAEQALVRARNRGTTVGVLILDIDHFKSINDTYGHPDGDRVLRAIAEELIAETRDHDACGRWGGEEFAIVLPDVGSAPNLYRVAERIRVRIQSVRLDRSGGHGPPIANLTASLGAAIYPAAGINSLDELVLAADTALYAAKNAGRNQVRLSAGAVTSIPEQQPRTDIHADSTDTST